MNQSELLQLMIVNAVEKGVEQALEKKLKPIQEELTKIKALNVKLLKEQANLFTQGGTVLVENNVGAPRIPVKTQVREVQYNTPNKYPSQINEDVAKKQQQEQVKSQIAGLAGVQDFGGMMGAGENFALPDIDIDPGLFLKRH